MKKLLLCLLALVILLTASALADVKVVKTTELDGSVTLLNYSNNYIARNDSGYALYDISGNVLSATYKDMNAVENGKYIKVQNVSNASNLNCVGLLDAQGNEILSMRYGSIITYYAEDWVFAHVLVKADGDVGEYSDSKGNKYIIESTDVVYKGQMIGTLSREEYKASYNVTDRGPSIFIKINDKTGYWLSSDFTRRDVTADAYVDTSEYSYGYKKPVVHNPTGQEAFTASCTLTPEQVKQHVWYDEDNARILDLQGNALAENVHVDYPSYHENYFEVRDSARNRGVMAFDGTMVIPTQYAQIARKYDGHFASGYNAVVDADGNLYYYDEAGNITASAEYQISYNDYKGFGNNAPIVYVKNLGKYIIITATNGVLPETYEEAMACGENQKVIRVKKDGKWGVIDMAGNVVVPFEYDRYTPEVSDDGTVVLCQKSYSECVLYQLADEEQKASAVDSIWAQIMQSGANVDTTPVLNEGAWECTCGTITTGKFCPECGQKKPEPTPTPAPADDGSWTCTCGTVNASKFCPECGQKKPEDPQCQSCGYKPEGAAPKFCPECGTKF